MIKIRVNRKLNTKTITLVKQKIKALTKLLELSLALINQNTSSKHPINDIENSYFQITLIVDICEINSTNQLFKLFQHVILG